MFVEQDQLRNLSFKSVTAWKWISNHCQNSGKYILKIDDDTVPNIYGILDLVSYLKKSYPHIPHSYFCEILKKPYVDRDPVTCYKKKFFFLLN